MTEESKAAIADLVGAYGEKTTIAILLSVINIDACIEISGAPPAGLWGMILRDGYERLEPGGAEFKLPGGGFLKLAKQMDLAPGTQRDLLAAYLDLRLQGSDMGLDDFLAAITSEAPQAEAAPAPVPPQSPPPPAPSPPWRESPTGQEEEEASEEEEDKPEPPAPEPIAASHILPREEYEAFRQTVEAGELEIEDQPLLVLPVNYLYFTLRLSPGDAGLWADAYLCTADGEVVHECPPRDSPYGIWSMAPRGYAPIELEILEE